MRIENKNKLQYNTNSSDVIIHKNRSSLSDVSFTRNKEKEEETVES